MAELGELIQEQDATVCQANFPRAGLAPTADQAGLRYRVMRSAEGPLGDQRGLARQEPGDAVDARHHEGFV